MAWSFQNSRKTPVLTSASDLFSQLKEKGVIIDRKVKRSNSNVILPGFLQMKERRVEVTDEQATNPSRKKSQKRTGKQIGKNSRSEERCPSPCLDNDYDSDTSSNVPVEQNKNELGIAHCTQGKRIYDKKHSCLYCQKLYPKLARHLEQCHKDQAEIALILSLPKKSHLRKTKLMEILKKGDFLHNKEVLTKKSGLIIPRKRPRKNIKDTAQYLPCAHCLGMYMKKDLWRHARKCKSNHQEKGLGSIQAAGKMLLPISVEVSQEFRQAVLSSMVADEVSEVIMKDSLILALGERFFLKCKSQQHQLNYVKQKMREIGRFVLSMRKLRQTNLIHLTECINPALFQDVVAAVRKLCKYDERGQFTIPSLGLKLGHSLKKCALLLRSQALQRGDDDLKKKASDFLELYASDWATEISTLCLQTLHNQTFNKPKRIPLAQDLKTLSNYLEEKASSLKFELDKKELQPNAETWRELNELTLAQIVLFNRRRGGETERIELSQYEEGMQNMTEMQEEIASGLSSFEKKLASTLTRIEVRGKRGRKVPVLLTKKHKERIDCLLRHREIMGVSHENKFLFPRCGNTLSCLRSSDALRKYATECGAKQPQLLTSTTLRKHIATISQILNLKDHELDSLAGFLGHDINVHRNFYRLPEDTVQVAKIGKILVELDNGRIAKYKGKSLDEIDLDVDEEIELDPNDSDGDQEENDPEEENITNEGENLTTSPKIRKDTASKMKTPTSSASEEKHQSTSGKKHRKITMRRPWSAEEKTAINQNLSKYFMLNRLPGKNEIIEAQQREPILQQRPWRQIKFFIKNMKTSPNFLS